MITLTSTAFQDGDMIPPKYTCSGENISPQLAWSGVPANVVSLALLCLDPDAQRGTWTHWVLYHLPPETTALPESVPPQPTLANGACQGVNSSHTVGYTGPCPPPGAPHRYYFTLYALDIQPELSGEVMREQLERAMQGHIIAEGQCMGRFAR